MFFDAFFPYKFISGLNLLSFTHISFGQNFIFKIPEKIFDKKKSSFFPKKTAKKAEEPTHFYS